MLTVEAPADIIDDLRRAFERDGISFIDVTSRRLTGETILCSIVLPIALTAVQIVADYILQRRSEKIRQDDSNSADLVIYIVRDGERIGIDGILKEASKE